MRIGGIDEAGKGCVLGSLHLAIAIIKDPSKLDNLGLKDSKKLSKKKREEIYSQLTEILDSYEVIKISPQEIDQGNLLSLEAEKSRYLINQHHPDVVYVDCPHPKPEKYKKELENKFTMVVSEHKADDKYLICSAASVLAKVERDRELENLGLKISGYSSDPKTVKHLHTLYPDFPNYVRKSWKTVKRIVEENSQ